MAKQRQTVWSSNDREEWIANAIQSSDERDIKDGYSYTKMLRNVESLTEHIEDGKRGFVTACLAHAIYDNDVKKLRRLSLCFYSALMNKMFNNSYLHLMYRRNNFIILMKGSNAYKLLLRHLPEQKDIEYSDLDIVMYINPNLDDDNFEQLQSSLIIMVSQVMSRYKRDLDAVLFPAHTRTHTHIHDIVSPEHIEEFKASFEKLLGTFIPGAANAEPGVFHSPFDQDTQTRFRCSKRSFIIANSSMDDNLVVRVEVPHLDKCDCIPLRKTPLVLSHNMAIRFPRDIEGHYQADFHLLRLRLNTLYENTEITSDTHTHTGSDMCVCDTDSHEGVGTQPQKPKKSFKIVPTDFIDVSIPSKHDSELLHFWDSDGFNNCHEVYDETIEACITIPNVHECVRDLTNMLYIYTNNQNLVKYEKRLKRLELLKELDTSQSAWNNVQNIVDNVLGSSNL